MSVVSSVEAPAKVTDAIRKASRATGTDFHYLLKTAARESSFKADAKARTSSASGLFQFIENTWLQTVKEEGHRFGLGDYSADIRKSPGGRYHVPDAGRRREILALRNDPEVAAMMAGAFTRQNADYVSSRLGREADPGELYMAHFLGPSGAARLIELADARPDARADTHFPKAARANRAIFYEGGRPRSLSQVYAQLVDKHRAVKSAPGGSTGAQAPAAPGDAGTPRREVKVAALAANALRTEPGTLTDVGLGSIGGWHAIVRPELDAVPFAADQPDTQPTEPTARPQEVSPRTSPPTPSRQGPPSPLRLSSSAFGLLQDDFWRQLSMGGS